ncbi:uncharacterized protein FIBRA_04235 [Fibroporia radiculosa]|uniref:Polyketide synthase phosphopantetheine-binding domain-containing protein n=1 Tax=Fibroporia radiculosa TaxID=599839 RepID=J4HWF2_9APHY|nr:uncharacterized protein FIBRA_04235 [Fibroporia radiculosa]CCM02157.1 predicted protein [Fibroporia radiculosa]
MAVLNAPVLPSLDGTLSVLPDIVDFHAEHNLNLPIFVFPNAFDEDKITTVSFLEFANATSRIAHIARPARTGPDGEVIIVLVSCDTLLYHTLLVGLVRAGLVPFLMSPRNSAPAIASMMERTGCHRVVTQPAFASLADAIQTELPPMYSVQLDDLPVLADIFPSLLSSYDPSRSLVKPYPRPKNAPLPSDVVLYLHSSGSTGHPKPIPQTNTTLLHWCHLPLIAEPRARGIHWGCMALPPFHTMGLSTQLLSPLSSGCPTSLFAPRALVGALPVVPTPQNTLETARKTGCNAIESVPTFVEAWSHSEDDIKYLASLRALVFAGGPLSTANGRKLVAGGVRLFACYGATEFGTLTRLFDDDVDGPSPVGKTRDDWEWMQMPKECIPRWIAQGDGTFELQLLPSVENLPNGEHGYSTSDVWVPHPSKPGLWRIVGRSDDVIVLGSGEKTVPVPLENHITAHLWVAGAVMFGRGRQQVGIIIEPQQGREVRPGDENGLARFRNAIWHQVEEANRAAPGFSRIFKEMILVADPERPFVRAAKGTIQRKKTLELYDKDIEELYVVIEESRDAHGVVPPSSWSLNAVQTWLTEHATAINGGKAPILDKDIFEQGFDSLSATYLRNRIIGVLRQSSDTAVNAAAQSVPSNFIFQNPTLFALAAAIESLIHTTVAFASQSKTVEIDAMITKYAALLPVSPSLTDSRSGGGAVVLLTGSTGALGAHILALLLADQRVKVVYALNRGTKLEERQKAAFDTAQLPTALLQNAKLMLLSGDLTREDLGLEKRVSDELSASITHIIHNAWRVDFNLSLASFESQIATAIKLLALSPGAYYLFTSSVSVAGGWFDANCRGAVPEQALHNSRVAATTSGYGMSKYVVEEVLSKAREQGMRTTSLRIAQICGSSTRGAWNTSDWVPTIVKSSVALGALPELDGAS